MRGVSLTHPVLALLLCGEFPLHIPCLLFISVGSLSYTSSVSLSLSSELASLLCGEFLLHIPCWLLHLLLLFLSFLFFYFFIWEFLLHILHWLYFFCGEFLLHIPCWLLFSFSFFVGLNLGSFSYTSCAGFIFMRGVSLTNPVLALFLSGEFLLHIPCLLFISVGSLS